ncbi:response regulator transcription factor [Candidatus Methylospira mobilis]|nr:response regulator transcription factor [Candidatus Methylospira mobilis]WNV06195.1 response regulator transcription factor [Candidatus Methylospira mobilis]
MVAIKILLVEDDRKAARLLAKGLKEEGFAVDVAHSVEEGEEQACYMDYNLIVLDWLLPGKEGIVLCRELRRRGIRAPILMLTARDAVSDRIAGLNTGADDYLTKPFVFEELMARIRALLRRSEPAQPGALTVADITLDPGAHRVTRGSRPIVLTPKEYAILEILMRQAGQVVSRTSLAGQVWKTDLIGIDNLIDAHISNLRRKIDPPDARPLIETVRSRGFRLVKDEPGAMTDEG